MMREIIKLIENSNISSIIRDFESIIFYQKSAKPTKTTDPYVYLKDYDLGVIKGIGPKIKMKLKKFGIENLYDLIKCQSIQGFSDSRLGIWKQSALALD